MRIHMTPPMPSTLIAFSCGGPGWGVGGAGALGGRGSRHGLFWAMAGEGEGVA